MEDDMPGEDILNQAAKEQRRLVRTLRGAGAKEERIAALRPVIENTALMCAKLQEARDQIADAQIIVEYDNGGGQTGTRENPVLRGYESLWKAYMLGMAKILEALPQEAAEKEKAAMDKKTPGTVLDIVMARRRANG